MRPAPTLVLALLLPILSACGTPVPQADSSVGRQLYLSRGCAVCHGPDGAGDGPAARATRRPPRDLRDRATYRQPPSLATISAVIATGLDPALGGMPAQPFLPEDERRQIAAFVLALGQSSTSGKGTRP